MLNYSSNERIMIWTGQARNLSSGELLHPFFIGRQRSQVIAKKAFSPKPYTPKKHSHFNLATSLFHNISFSLPFPIRSVLYIFFSPRSPPTITLLHFNCEGQYCFASQIAVILWKLILLITLWKGPWLISNLPNCIINIRIIFIHELFSWLNWTLIQGLLHRFFTPISLGKITFFDSEIY